MRRLIAACSLAGSLLVGGTAPAASTTVVISEFRARGPNGATDEFIELFNVSNAPVTLTGYRILVSDGAGATKPLAQINTATVLQPRHFYLLVNALGYSGNVAGNTTYTENVPDDGGIALLTAGNAIVDQVGMSATSAYVEGTPLDPLLDNVNQSYERNNGGCAATKDTDDNAADFRLNASQSFPQNTSTNCNTCVGVTCAKPPNLQCWASTGTCKAGACSYVQSSVGAACTDGDACTVGDQCDAAGVCSPSASATCDTPPGSFCSDPQTLQTFTGPGTCATATGCSYTQTGTHCQFGCNGKTSACNPDPCTNVSCNAPPPSGCYESPGICTNGTCVYTAKPRNTPCTDGDACTVGDVCDSSGKCLSGAGATIDDGDPCTTDACDSGTGTVSHTIVADGTSCDDGNLCNGAETCQADVCAAGTAVTCSTPPPGGCYQTSGTCNPANGICTYAPLAAGSSCTDKDSCTTGDQCDGNGACGGTDVVCPPLAPACIDSSTQQTLSAGVCLGGSCSYTTTNKHCDAGCDAASGLCAADPCAGVTCPPPPDQCHAAGVCAAGGCTFAVTPGAGCDDGDPCTNGDQCSPGGACAGTPLLCNTPTLPTCVDATTSRQYDVTGVCTGGSCAYAPSLIPCADGCDAATGFCKADPCAGVTCDSPPDQCHQALGTCDSASGQCTYELKPDGSTCDDVNPCTDDDVCTAGTCTGAPVACAPKSPTCVNGTTSRQFVGQCDALGACAYTPTTPDTTCDHGCNVTTGLCNGDPCASTVCASPPGSCYLGTGTCSSLSGACVYAPLTAGVTCDDGNPCTAGDACDGAGQCGGVVNASCGADGGSISAGDASVGSGGASGSGVDGGTGGGVGTGGTTSGADASGAGGAVAVVDGGESGGGIGGVAGASSGGSSAGGTAGTAGSSGTGGAVASAGGHAGAPGASGGAPNVGLDGGLPDAAHLPPIVPNAEGGCGCSVPGRTNPAPWSLAVVAGLAVFARRRKSRSQQGRA